MDNEKYNVVSLFSGCGGLDIGIANAGTDQMNTDTEDGKFNYLWSNDDMEHACKTLAKNFDKELVDEVDDSNEKGVVYNGDIREVNFGNIIDQNEVNLVLGGFPCQDFSILRGDDNRGGIEVQRGKLYLEYARSLASLQPEMFIAENVKGLTSANDGKAYERIIEDFEKLDREWEDIATEFSDERDVEDVNDVNGYEILYSDVVDFSELGVPQGRERLIIIGLRKDLIDSVEDETDTDIDEWKEQITSDLNSKNDFDVSPLTAIETFTGDTFDTLSDEYESIMKSYEDYIMEIDSERGDEYRDEVWPEYTFDIWDDYEWRNSISNVDESQVLTQHKNVLNELGYKDRNLSNLDFEDGSNEEMREMDRVLERLRHIAPDENHRMVKNTEHHVSGMMSNIYRRLHPLQPSTTIIASGGGGTWGYHYERERGKLTNRERARIQTFPDDFLFHGTNSEVRKQIGNAVPPLGAKRVGESILPILESVVE